MKKILNSRMCRTAYLSFSEYLIFKKGNKGRRTSSHWLILYRTIRPCKLSRQGGKYFTNVVLIDTSNDAVGDGLGGEGTRLLRSQ